MGHVSREHNAKYKQVSRLPTIVLYFRTVLLSFLFLAINLSYSLLLLLFDHFIKRKCFVKRFTKKEVEHSDHSGSF